MIQKKKMRFSKKSLVKMMNLERREMMLVKMMNLVRREMMLVKMMKVTKKETLMVKMFRGMRVMLRMKTFQLEGSDQFAHLIYFPAFIVYRGFPSMLCMIAWRA